VNEGHNLHIMPVNYPPYVNGYGNIVKLFREIQKASVPPKFTNDFMVSVLGLKSTSYRAMIPLLKRLGFLDQANVPTQTYKDYRDESKSRSILAEQLRKAYSELYLANEYCHKLSKTELIGKLKTLTGAGADDKVIPAVASTFSELVKLADFENAVPTKPKSEEEPIHDEDDSPTKQPPHQKLKTHLGLSYTINLNLPATTEIEVFNAIFKSLKEHILFEK
jgi:hypothetical protein